MHRGDQSGMYDSSRSIPATAEDERRYFLRKHETNALCMTVDR